MSKSFLVVWIIVSSVFQVMSQEWFENCTSCDNEGETCGEVYQNEKHYYCYCDYRELNRTLCSNCYFDSFVNIWKYLLVTDLPELIGILHASACYLFFCIILRFHATVVPCLFLVFLYELVRKNIITVILIAINLLMLNRNKCS